MENSMQSWRKNWWLIFKPFFTNWDKNEDEDEEKEMKKFFNYFSI